MSLGCHHQRGQPKFKLLHRLRVVEFDFSICSQSLAISSIKDILAFDGNVYDGRFAINQLRVCNIDENISWNPGSVKEIFLLLH